MTAQNKQIIQFAVIALVIYAVWSYYFNREEIKKDKPFTKGYSVEQIEMRMTNEDGELSTKFKSPSLIRYTDSPVLFIDSPIVWTYENNKEHWLIKANKAELNTQTNKVELLDSVNAHSLDEKEPMVFITENLILDLSSKKAQTSDGISIQQAQSSMQGQIAHIDLKNKIIEVNNNVKAVYKSIK
jgi:LPS export ABC transporter protein LptC